MTENKLSEQELNEIINFIGSKVYYDEQSQYIMAEGGKANVFLELRGWGAITSTIYKNENDAAKFQDRIGKWVVDAVNDKLSNTLTRERERVKPVIEALEFIEMNYGDHDAVRDKIRQTINNYNQNK